MRAITIALYIAVSLSGLVSAGELTDSAEIHFRQSRSVLEPEFKNNRVALDSISNRMDMFEREGSDYRLKSVKVIGGASPEGSVDINRRLSERRAESIFRYFSGYVVMPDSITSFDFIGRDWKGLYELASVDSNVPYRDDVMKLVSDILVSIREDGSDNAGNLLRLKQLHSGIPYDYMYRNIFPKLRESRLYIEYEPVIRHIAQIPAPLPTLLPVAFDMHCPLINAHVNPSNPSRPFYMALKTNMLYDAVALPNIGAEFYLGKNWSIAANWMYGWWDNDHSHRYWRAYGGDLTLRHWFGHKAEEKPLTGHHLGIYGGVVTFDFEFGGTGYMGGLPGRTLWDRCCLTAGVEYGYSLPVSRRINIDFTIGLGYLGGKYIKYVPVGPYYKWESTNRLNWFGPTKAEVSLVWLIGHDNYNRKKGGRL